MSDKEPAAEVQIARITTKGTIITAIIAATVSLFTLLIGLIKVGDVRERQEKFADDLEHKDKINLYYEFPVGTIVPSILDFQDFSKQISDAQNPANFNPQDKNYQWSPADGRNVSNSSYHLLTGKNSVPDLRGLFLRNVNDYGVDYPGVKEVDSSRANPQKKVAGEFQSDAIKKHKHQFVDQYRYGNAHKSYGNAAEVPNSTNYENKSTNFNEGGLSETRPKNMTVYHYIKIN